MVDGDTSRFAKIAHYPESKEEGGIGKGRCSLRSLDLLGTLPASSGEKIVPSLPHAVKGRPSVLRTLDSGRLSTKRNPVEAGKMPLYRYMAIYHCYQFVSG